MKKLGIGIVMVALGLPGTAYFFSDLITLIMGAIPVLLILGGGLAAYLGYEDLRAEKDSPMPDAPPQCADDDSPQESQDLTGNTDTLVFHSLTCNFAQGKNCTALFRDRDDAIAQGYKPCKICNP